MREKRLADALFRPVGKRLVLAAVLAALLAGASSSAQVGGVFGFDDGTPQGWRIAGLYEDGGLEPIPDFFSDVPAPWRDDLDAPSAPPGVDKNDGLIGAIVLGKSPGQVYPVGLTFWAWHFNSPDLDSLPEWQSATKARIRVTNLMTTEGPASRNWIQFVVVIEDVDHAIRYFTDGVFHEIPPNVPLASRSWSTSTLDIASLRLPQPSTLRRLQLRVFGENDYYAGFIALDDVTPMFCGDGVADAGSGEQCDEGAANGTLMSCCNSDCAFRSAGAVCRELAGACDVAETCTGASASCPGDAKSTAVCRVAAGPCDVAESCNGVSNGCPADMQADVGTPCDDGNPCTSSDRCAGDTCAGTQISCPAEQVCNPVSGTCGPIHVPCADKASCDDGDACTGGDACAGGECHGVPLTCDDGNPCTADRCEPQVGCRAEPVPDGQACGEDDDGCTRGSVCGNGVCGKARCDVEVSQVTDPQTGDPLPAIDVECALPTNKKGKGSGRCSAEAFVDETAAQIARPALAGEPGLGKANVPPGESLSDRVKGRIKSGRVTLRLSLTDRGKQLLQESGAVRVRVVARLKRGAGKRKSVIRFLNLLRSRH
jgi:hypothetical protein